MYDTVIIGRGPAGLSASLYTVRSNLKTLIVGKNDSALRKAQRVDNYFGFSNVVSGEFLLQEGEKQALRLGAEIVEDEVISIDKNGHFEVFTPISRYLCKTVLLATGQPVKKLMIQNLTEYEGKGISYCTTCDGFFYRNMKAGVIGFKDFAIHEAMEMQKYTEDITVFTDGFELELSKKFKEEALRFKINKKPILRFDGGEFLERIIFKDNSSEKVDGVFIAYESASSIDFARKLGIVTKGNSVIIDKSQQTNLEGLFAAGDCTGGLKQIASAVGQGALAGIKIADYLRNK